MAKDKLYQVRVFATVAYENSEIEAEDEKEAFNIAVNEIEEQLKKTDLELLAVHVDTHRKDKLLLSQERAIDEE